MQHARLHNGPSKASAQSQHSRPPRLPPPGTDARFSGVSASGLGTGPGSVQGPSISRGRVPMASRALEKEKEQRASAWVRAANPGVNGARAYPSLQPHDIQDSQPQQQHAPQQQQQGEYDFQRAQLLSTQHDIPYQANGLSMLPAQNYASASGQQYGSAPFFDALSKGPSISPQQQMLPSVLDKGLSTSPPQLHQKQHIVQDERLLIHQQQQRHYQHQQHYQQQHVQHHQQQAIHQQHHHGQQQRNSITHKQDFYHQALPDQDNSHYQALRQHQDMQSQLQQQQHAQNQYHHEQIPSVQQQQHQNSQDHLTAHHQQALSHHLPDHAQPAQQHMYQELHPSQQPGNHVLMRQMHNHQQQHQSIPDTHLDHSYGLPLPAQDPTALRKAPAELSAWDSNTTTPARGAQIANHPRDGAPDYNPAALIQPVGFVANQLFDIGLGDVRQPPPLPVHSSQQHGGTQQASHLNAQQQGVSAQHHGQQQQHTQQPSQPPQVPNQRQSTAQQRAPVQQRAVRAHTTVQQRGAPSTKNAGHPSQRAPQGQPPVSQQQPSRRVVKQQPTLVPNGQQHQPLPASVELASGTEGMRQQPTDSRGSGSRVAVNGNGIISSGGPSNRQQNGIVKTPVHQPQQPLAVGAGDAAGASQQPEYYKNVRKVPPPGAAQSTPRKRRLNEPQQQDSTPAVANPNQITCQYCGQCFDQKRLRDLHVRTHHERSFPCDKCYSLFKTKSDANRHMRIVHEGVRPFSCTECKATFAERGKLRRHKQTVHEKLRPFHCPVCGAQFGERGNLNQHQTSRHAGTMLNSSATTANRAT